MLDKRKCERKHAAGEVSGKMILVDHLDIINLSESGIRIQCSRRVNMNDIHRIKIQKHGISLDIKGQVVRSTLSVEKRGAESVTFYDVAMTFRNLSQETKKTLEKLISLLGNG